MRIALCDSGASLREGLHLPTPPPPPQILKGKEWSALENLRHNIHIIRIKNTFSLIYRSGSPPPPLNIEKLCLKSYKMLLPLLTAVT